MANEELITLLEKLKGTGASGGLDPGLLAQLPALVNRKTESPAAGGEARAVAGALAATALRTAGGGLTLLPVVGALLGLLGVGKKKEEALPELPEFALPAPIRAEAGLGQNGETFLIDRGAGDRIRALPRVESPLRAGESALPAAGRPLAAAPGAETGANTGVVTGSRSTAITVNVQAMDSQSFLDRREDIARAVREAMLESHSLNDVVSEL